MNRDFHMAIYEAAGSPRLIEMVGSLMDSSMVYLIATWRTVPDLRERAGQDHSAILEALRARDAETAVAQIRRHLSIPRSVLQLDH